MIFEFIVRIPVLFIFLNAAAYLGKVIAKKALDKGIKTVVFDRGGFIYQGKIAALAEAARQAGLEF